MLTVPVLHFQIKERFQKSITLTGTATVATTASVTANIVLSCDAKIINGGSKMDRPRHSRYFVIFQNFQNAKCTYRVRTQHRTARTVFVLEGLRM